MFHSRVAQLAAGASACLLMSGILSASSPFAAVHNFASAGANATSIAIVDVNKDGKPDSVVANYCLKLNDSCAEGGVSIFLGNGDGTFQKAVRYSTAGRSAVAVAVADVNNDGNLDVLVANSCVSSGNCTVGEIGVLLGNGDGTFRPVVNFSSGGQDAQSIAVADVNGDGAPDLLVVNFCIANNDCSSGGVGVLLGNGDGTFQPAVSYGSGGVQGYSIAVADVNQDGKPDVVVANLGMTQFFGEGGVGVLLGNGDGTFQAAQSYSTDALEADSIAVADLNGDGRPDLVVANDCFDLHCGLGGVGAVSVLLGNGDGTFQPVTTFGSGGAEAQSIAVADVNGDGTFDVVVANLCVTSGECKHGTIGVLLGNGDGTFQPASRFGTAAWYTRSVAVADVNGDGRPDLLITDECLVNSTCGDSDGVVGVLLQSK